MCIRISVGLEVHCRASLGFVLITQEQPRLSFSCRRCSCVLRVPLLLLLCPLPTPRGFDLGFFLVQCPTWFPEAIEKCFFPPPPLTFCGFVSDEFGRQQFRAHLSSPSLCHHGHVVF